MIGRVPRDPEHQVQAFGLAKVEYARNYGSAALRHDENAVDAAA